MAYEVSTNVPIPTGAAREPQSTYNFHTLEVGHSIFVPEEDAPDGNLDKLRKKVYNAARGYGNPKGKKFLALVVEEERDNPLYPRWVDDRDPLLEPQEPKIKVKGVRCWYEADVEKTPSSQNSES